MACDKRRANEDQARHTEYEEVSLPPYIFLSMPVLLTTSTSYIFHPLSGHLTEKASSWRSFLACLTKHINFIYYVLFRSINRVRGVQGPDRFSDRQDSEIVEFSPALHACPTNSNVGAAPRSEKGATGDFKNMVKEI